MSFGAPVKSAVGLASTATVNPSFGSATTPGNLIVLAFAADDYNGTPGAGWTQSSEMEQQTFHGGYIWWRISAGETSFSYVIGSATTSSWCIAEWAGNDPAPYDTSQGTFLQSGGLTIATDVITPSVGERLLVAAVGGSSNSATMAGTYDSWTNSFTAVGSNGQSSGNATCIGMAYRVVTGDGVTTFTTTADYAGVNSPQARSALAISFNPAAVAGAAPRPNVSTAAVQRAGSW